MSQATIPQELTRLSTAVQRLRARARDSRVTLELFDAFDTTLELVFRHDGNYVRGRVRSRAGDADFELYGVEDRVAFKHPALDHLSALRMPVDAYAGAASIRYSLSDEALAERIVKSARKLQHIALLKKVETGLGQRRRTGGAAAVARAA
jgi:hypothetical protein